MIHKLKLLLILQCFCVVFSFAQKGVNTTPIPAVAESASATLDENPEMKLETPFPHPAWSLNSNIYEVNLRQFSKEGTFTAFSKELPRLKKMGVEILWFMPITPISVKGRKMTEKDLGSYYAVQDYKAVNPEFGTMKDFIALVKKAHDMGFKVITDWVPNHTGLDNKWTEKHPDFYEKDTAGKFISPFDWTDVYKLNYNNKELCDSMIDAMKFWITTANIDGFRCDVAEPVPAFFWKTCISQLKQLKDVFMLAEGNLAWLHQSGFDATYNWNAMSYTRDLYEGKMSASTFVDSLNSNYTRYPANAMRLNFTTNHDENSWNGTEFEKYGDAYKMFAVFTMTYRQSIPLVYNGQEIPNKKRLKFFVKDPIIWSGYEMAPFYETLLKLRKSNSALSTDADYKQIKTTESDVFAYLRTKNEKKVLTILNLSSSDKSFKLDDSELLGEAKDVFKNKTIMINNDLNFNIGPWGFNVLSFE